MNDESLDLSGLIKVVRERWRMIVGIIAISSFFFLFVSFLLPKKYKVSSALTIYTKYFQNPLVKDFLPEIYDNSELKSQRETLIKKAFSSEFLSILGEKYKLFKTEKTDPRRSLEEYELFKRIEVFSVETTTFSISYVGKSAMETYQVMDDIVKRVTATLAGERKKTILQLRDSIRKRIETMAITMDNTTDPLASVRPELLQVELDRLRAQINALRSQYTDKHPMLSKLIARAEVIKKWLATSSAGKANSALNDSNQAALVGGEPKDPTLLVYTDLLKKMNYLNIVLEMEDSADNAYVGILQAPMLPDGPVFPKKSVFLFWGLLTGLMVSMVVLLAQEYVERTQDSPEEFAQKVGLDYFGPLPIIAWKQNGGPKHPKGEKTKKEGSSLDGWQ